MPKIEAEKMHPNGPRSQDLPEWLPLVLWPSRHLYGDIYIYIYIIYIHMYIVRPVYNGRPREATGGHVRPREATGGHGRPREAMGGHGRPRETTEATSCAQILAP